MFRNHFKVQAYTVVEMLIVMILSTIVIGLAVMVLSLIQRHVNTIGKADGINAEILTLDKALTNDMDTFTAYYDNQKEELLFQNPTDTVIYKFMDSFLLRNEDTIKVAIQEKKFYLETQEKKQGDVDAIELFIKDYELFFFKNPAADFYINKKQLNLP